MNFTKYDDGFFCINEINGFLPKYDPLETLPEDFKDLQDLLDNIPIFVASKNIDDLNLAVFNLPNHVGRVKKK